MSNKIQTKKHNPLTAFDNILGDCSKMKKLFRDVRKVASSPNATVLILGESGTGKELVARAIHYASPKSNQPFVEINCTTLPDNLLESELFGYEPGAFTDAKRIKKGLLELADGGTFFLDEVGDLNITLQAKLLKVLDEKVFRRVGGIQKIKVTMRIIAATNKNLYELVLQKIFREDLYYRLDVITIHIPALRERGNDILLLADHFMKIANKEHTRHVHGFSGDAKDMFLKYPWPGNVRELKNAVERAVLLSTGNILGVDDLKLGAGHIVNDYPVKVEANDKIEISIPAHGVSLEELEIAALKKVLELSAGNKSKAARLLKISREKLRSRLRKYNLNGASSN